MAMNNEVPVRGEPFAASTRHDEIDLTESQRAVWLSLQTQPDGALAFNEGFALSLTGVVDPEVVRLAAHELVRRHDALRSTLGLDGRQLHVHPVVSLDIPIVDAPGSDDLRAVEAGEMQTGFDLEHGPAIRFRIVRESDTRLHLLIVAHHIVFDDWSASLFASEFLTLYAGLREGSHVDLPMATSFAEYSSDERTFESSPEGQAHIEYWVQHLQEVPPPVEFPMDRPRPARRTYAAANLQYRIAPDLAVSLAQLGSNHGTGSTATALALFAALLHRVTGSSDVVIGLTVPGQPFHRRERVVGHCIHFLPLRVSPSSETQFDMFLDHVDRTLRDAVRHQGVAFGRLLQRLKTRRDPLRPPLVSVTFNVEALDLSVEVPGIDVEFRRLPRASEMFDLSFTVVTRNGALFVECAYNADLFSHDLVEARIEEFEELLRSASTEPVCPLGRLNMLSARRREALTRWNDTRRAYPLDSTLPDLLSAAARRWSDTTAVVADQTVSYREIAERARSVANHLRVHGVGPDVLVGVCAYRSVEMVIALLGILEAGGAYLPLDPDDPAERLTFMVEDADCRTLLAGPGLGEGTMTWLRGLGRTVLEVAAIDRAAPLGLRGEPPTPDSLAYVIYTSGSTGRPKGTLLTHRGIVNRLLWGQEHYPIGPGDRLLQKTSYSFDVSVPEFFWPLMNGATLVMARPGGHKDPDYLVEVIQREGISVCHFVPSMMGPFLDHPRSSECKTLRHVFASGEALPYYLTRRFYDRLPWARLHNLYGPTEASVEVSYWDCPAAGDSRGLVPIGRPVANTQLHVLDPRGEPVPLSVPGELHIGGVQLSRGYLNRPELTNQQFVSHPRLGRLYRTGDVARWLPDGVIDFLGRQDGQVKLRGFRIELAEIEAQLTALPEILEAIVLVRERVPGDPWLVAWVRPRPGERLAPRDLGHSLASRLPGHMVPQVFVEVAEFPRLTSGKIDRNKLPTPFGSLAAARFDREEPVTPQEIHLARTWQALLGVDAVGRQDRFADLGGHSLLAVQLVSGLEQHYGVRLPLRAVMMESLSVLARQLPGSDQPEERRASRRTETAAPRQDAFFFGDRARHLFGSLTVPAVQARRTGILICPSWSVEYMRAYRGLNRLGERLGFHDFAVLRFDYASTGDSAGDSSEARVEDWLENIEIAADELRRRAPVDQVCIVGLRLGALLAQSAVGRGVKASHLLLWDPPADGAGWLENLRGFDDVYHQTLNSQRPRHLKLPEPPSDQLLGLPLPTSLRAAIECLRLTTAPAGVRQVVAVSADSPALSRFDGECLHLPTPGEWSLLSRMTTPWNPVPSINLVVEALHERLL